MTDFISREEATELLSQPITMSMCLSTEECHHKIAQQRIDRYLIENIPAADVRPVVRSKWIKMKFFPDWECKKCGSVISGNTPDPWNHYHFCPNCGADMRIFSTNCKNTVTTGEDREISNLRAWLKNCKENKTK